MLTWLPKQGPTQSPRARSAGRTSASSCSTWKGSSTSRSEDADSLEDASSDLVRAAEDDLETVPPEVGDPGELIEWANGYTFLLHVPGGTSADVAVEVLSDRLKAGSINFELERCFPERVEPETATSSCVNGVLSIRVSRSL